MESTHSYICLCSREMRVVPFGVGRLTRCPRCRRFVVVPTEWGEVARQPVFELFTGQLRVKLASRRHWREIHRIYSDARNYEYEISGPSSKRDTKIAITKSCFPSGFAKSNQLIFRISTLLEDRVVGTITVSFSIPYYSAYIGFMIHKEDQGRGYGTEAISAVRRLLHDELKVERITALCDPKNRPCRQLLERAGFTQEGLLRRFFHHPDRGWIDSPLYASIRENYDNSQPEPDGRSR